MVTDARHVLARLSGQVPDGAGDLIETFLGSGGAPVVPAPAASVVLLREPVDRTGLEAYLLHRHSRMPFAPGHVVFPGGRAEPGETPVDCAVRETAEETSVAVPPSDLLPWAHWVTPEYEQRRYDTRFYVARLPDDAVARDVSGETVTAAWTSPAVALADRAAGRTRLLPPTEAVLLELADLADGGWGAVVAAATDRRISTVMPVPVRADDVGWRFDYGLG